MRGRAKHISFSPRNNRGVAMISLCAILSMMLVVVACFVYDMNNIQIAQRQLTALCDAAAMDGSALLRLAGYQL